MQGKAEGNTQFKIFYMISYAVRFILWGRRRLVKANQMNIPARQREGN